MSLNTLIDLLRKHAEARVFPCIRELITEGLHSERLSPDDPAPSRQDITQFVVAWFRHIGVPKDLCREWMIPYCTERLSVMSSSSISQIRHSTKSNVKYIYKSEVPFECGAKNNIFRASCAETCPLFDKMTEKHQQKMAEKAEKVEKRYEPERLDQKAIAANRGTFKSSKEQHREQFVKAMEFVCDQVAGGVTTRHIVKMLDEKGYKTRTGKKWSRAILFVELKKLREK